MKPVLVSGIQPTGKLHLGNYLGALKNFVELQNSERYSCYFFIADLHSLTEPYNPKEKQKQVMNVALDFLAAGIDPRKSVIFVQSKIPAHSELAWILNTITSFGELRRMTQFKEKAGSEDAITANVGLFDYPVLMAADILLYDAAFVPVGDDQLQHLELARTLARKFNSTFGKTLVEPKPLMTEVPRLMSLDDPSKKMSKSRPGGCLFIDDSPAVIKDKIKRAVTDSHTTIAYDPKNRPGISNLVLIYSAMSGLAIDKVIAQSAGKSYSEFKDELAKITTQALAPFQARKKKLAKDAKKVLSALATGEKMAGKAAKEKLAVIQKKIGLNG